MSTTINFIKVNILSFKELITIIDKDPVKHREEIPFANCQLELNLAEDVYAYAEKMGHERNYIVYVDDAYAGYMTIMASEMLHHKGIISAVTDAFYIVPKYRSSGAFTALLAYVENDLRSNGIRFLTLGINPKTPHVDKVKNFVHDRGYMHTDYSVTKEL